MAQGLTFALYGAMGLLLVVLAMGIINLVRNDDNQRSRSNKLMRARVIIQAIVIAILVVLGVVMGAFR